MFFYWGGGVLFYARFLLFRDVQLKSGICLSLPSKGEKGALIPAAGCGVLPSSAPGVSSKRKGIAETEQHANYHK